MATVYHPPDIDEIFSGREGKGIVRYIEICFYCGEKVEQYCEVNEAASGFGAEDWADLHYMHASDNTPLCEPVD